MQRKKRVLLGITGCIASYKACEIVSTLTKSDVEVKVIMTKSALELTSRKTLETLSKNRVSVDTFENIEVWNVAHIELAKWADLFLVAPATANSIAKFALGIADDMLSTTWLASNAPKMIAPAMNTQMYRAEAFQNNLNILKARGVEIISPVVGNLACGDTGEGKMQSPQEICKAVMHALSPNCDLQGEKIIVTAGGTSQPIDGVRHITNSSSGLMGVEIAKSLQQRGADVIFVHGNTTVFIPTFYKNVKVTTTQDMFEAVMKNLEVASAIVKAAAPCDFMVANYSAEKIKEKTFTLSLVPNVDIAFEVGKIKGDKVLCIFAAETSNVLENAKGKLAKKNADFVVANYVTNPEGGFNVSTNVATIITKEGEVRELAKMEKCQLAEIIASEIAGRINKAESE